MLGPQFGTEAKKTNTQQLKDGATGCVWDRRNDPFFPKNQTAFWTVSDKLNLFQDIIDDL